MVPGSFLIERKLPGVRRHEHFVKQNLGAGRIYFCQASEIQKGTQKVKDFLEPPGVRRIKRFAWQNLGAGRIYFCRASEIQKGTQKVKDFLGKKAGNPSSYLPQEGK